MHENIKFSEMGSLENLNPGTEFNFRVFSTFSRILNDKLETEELENTTGGAHKECDFNDGCREFIQSCFKKFCGLQQVTDCIFVPNIFYICLQGSGKK